MKLIYSHPNFAQVGLVRALLESEGIAPTIQNEHLSSLAGGLPALDTWPELWVPDEDVERAQTLIAQSQTTSDVELTNWVCPQCGVENDANMGICWNCDYAIDGTGAQ